MTNSSPGAVYGRLAIVVAVGVFIYIVAFGAGQDTALDKAEYEIATPRIGMNYTSFMKQCGDESLILRRYEVNGRIRVALHKDEWLACLNARLTKDRARGTILDHYETK